MSTSASPQRIGEPLVFNRDRHIKYWLRCLRTFLPTGYTSNDANRMLLACFTVCALDLLSVLDAYTTLDERSGYIEWIYSCQHPDGGFRAFNGTDFGRDKSSIDNELWDAPNIAGTFFALSALVVLGDDLQQVERKKTLEWVRRLQHEDGSFGEVLAGKGMPEGGQDVRWCFLATLIRWLLRGSTDSDIKDINVEALASFLLASQTYDGGIAKAPYREANAGWTYCGVSALTLLGKMPRAGDGPEIILNGLCASQRFVQDLVHWLVNRQTTMLDDSHIMETESDEESDEEPTRIVSEPGFTVVSHSPAPHLSSVETPQPLHIDIQGLACAGFNGRSNKPADTCYSWWAGASLGILGQNHLVDWTAARQYLLEKTQHVIGGFGKMPGNPPDILHSYLGLAALALMGEQGLQPIDLTLCMSVSAKERLQNLPWKKDRDLEEISTPAN